VGEYLAVQSDDWTTWSNNPGSGEDAFISDDYALSGTNSVKVDGTTDLVLIMDNYTEGCYSMDLNIYIPDGNCGYFNLQKTNVPGTEWGFQIQFDVTGEASIDGGAAAACVFPFDFDTWMNFEIIVDLDNDLCEFLYDGTLMHSYQWTLGTFGTPGLLQLGGMNMYAWASAGNNPLYYFDDVHVSTEPSEELTGYNVYLDGAFITYTTELQCALSNYVSLIGWEEYIAGVSAVYDDPGESIIVEVTFCYPGGITPPENLVATVFDYNDVHLEWEMESAWVLAHHSGYDNNGIGTGIAADWMCAARFDASDLADYYGFNLTSVIIHIRTADFSYVAVKIWEGGSFGDPGTEVYSADITSSVLIEDWTEHTLTTPIPLVAGNEYWIGYDISATGDHPSSVDAGPAVAGKGDWMFYEGFWQEISVAFGLDYNWCIEVVAWSEDNVLCTNSTSKKRTNTKIKTHHPINMVSDGTPEVLTSNPNTKRIENNRDSRMLLGYNVYRDGDVIVYLDDPHELTYDDLALNEETYEYWVTAILDVGETDPSNVEEVTVVLYPPQNVSAIVQGVNNVFITWVAPADRGLAHYYVYRNGDLIASNISSTFYLDIGLAAGTYTYNVAAVYDGGYFVLSDDTTVTVDVGGIPLPLVTELIGNYPNPFNPETIIRFGVKEDSQVLLQIYNIKGQLVKTLLDENLFAGYHEILWNGKDSDGEQVASGLYFYRMMTTNFSQIKKMLFLK
ncbi:MAG: T9SS type A sorting domain-containing protein, partial [Armatimonadetes bacterium]|nr:T9SS type A sorting domain-containing protein [Armatimonadota bacterium]